MIDTFLKSFAVEIWKEHLYWELWLAKVRDKPYHHNDGKAEPVDPPNVTWSKGSRHTESKFKKTCQNHWRTNLIAHTDEKSILSGNTKWLESQCHYEEAIVLMQKTGR